MAGQITPIPDIAAVGFVPDTPPNALPQNAFSMVNNIRFDDGAIRKIEGHQSILDIDRFVSNANIQYMAYWPNPNKDYIVLVNRITANGDIQDQIYLIDLDDDGSISEASYTPVSDFRSATGTWQHTLFNGGYSLIMNNGVDTPQHLTDTIGSDKRPEKFEDLPGWDSYNVDTIVYQVEAATDSEISIVPQLDSDILDNLKGELEVILEDNDSTDTDLLFDKLNDTELITGSTLYDNTVNSETAYLDLPLLSDEQKATDVLLVESGTSDDLDAETGWTAEDTDTDGTPRLIGSLKAVKDTDSERTYTVELPRLRDSNDSEFPLGHTYTASDIEGITVYFGVIEFDDFEFENRVIDVNKDTEIFKITTTNVVQDQFDGFTHARLSGFDTKNSVLNNRFEIINITDSELTLKREDSENFDTDIDVSNTQETDAKFEFSKGIPGTRIEHTVSPDDFLSAITDGRRVTRLTLTAPKIDKETTFIVEQDRKIEYTKLTFAAPIAANTTIRITLRRKLPRTKISFKHTDDTPNTIVEGTIKIIHSANDIKVRAGVIESSGSYLLAGDLREVTPSDIVVRDLAGVLRSSSVAPAGTIPDNWNPFKAGAGTADELVMANTGRIRAINTIQGNNYVYTDNSITQVEVNDMGLAAATLTEQYGATEVFEYNGQHIVVGSNDIYNFSGHPANIKSMADTICKKYFKRNRSDSFYENVDIERNQEFGEIWIGYANTNSTQGKLNTALIFNYTGNTWSQRDLPDLANLVSMPIPGGGVQETVLALSGRTGDGENVSSFTLTFSSGTSNTYYFGGDRFGVTSTDTDDGPLTYDANAVLSELAERIIETANGEIIVEVRDGKLITYPIEANGNRITAITITEGDLTASVSYVDEYSENRPWPKSEFNKSLRYIVGASNDDIFAMDLGYSFNGSPYTAYVERALMHVVPSREVESVDAFYLDIQGDIDTMELDLESVDNAHTTDIDVVANGNRYVFTTDGYKKDVRRNATGRYLNYRLSNTSSEDFAISSMGLSIRQGGTR